VMPEQTSTCGAESEQVNNSVSFSSCKNRADIGDGVRTSFDSVVHGWKFGSVGFLPSSHDKWSEERFNTVYQEISSSSPDDYRGNWLDYEGLKHTLDYCKRLGAGEKERKQFFDCLHAECDEATAFLTSKLSYIQTLRRAGAIASGCKPSRVAENRSLARSVSNTIRSKVATVLRDGDVVKKWRSSSALCNHREERRMIGQEAFWCRKFSQLTLVAIKRLLQWHDHYMGGCDGMNLYCDIVFESGSVKGILKYPWAMRLEVPEEFNRLARQPALHSGATTALDDGLGSEDMSTTRSCDDLVQEEGVSCPGCLEVMYKPIGLECGHCLCKLCILRGAHQDAVNVCFDTHAISPTCPICLKSCTFGGEEGLAPLNELVRKKFPTKWTDQQKLATAQLKKLERVRWQSGKPCALSGTSSRFKKFSCIRAAAAVDS